MTIGVRLLKKYLKGTGSGLIEKLSQNSPTETWENHEISQSKYAESKARFEQTDSRIEMCRSAVAVTSQWDSQFH
jgi:hypothetical protein